MEMNEAASPHHGGLILDSSIHDAVPSILSGSPAPSPSGAEDVRPAVVEEPKKSWASLLVPREGDRPLAAFGSSPSKLPTAVVSPFVVTSAEDKRHKELQKFERLGLLLMRKNLAGRQLDHRTVFLTPRGMMNRGNACYANAILQTLVFCPPFFHLLDSLCDAEPSLPSITRCLVNLVREFKQIPASAGRRGQLRSDDLPLDPSFVYDTIEECGSSAQQGMLSKGNQEDAQEFLNHILLLVHEEMVRGLASTSGSGEGNDYGGQSGGDEWMHIKKNQKKSILRDSDDFKESPVSYVFGGKLRSVRKLHGAKEFENVEPFFMLDLPIQDTRVKSVFGAIEKFMGTEEIHGFQDRGRHVRASRYYKFDQLPAVLILHLKYFEFSQADGMAKLQKTIDFEPTLRLPDRWFAPHYQPPKTVYKLSAVVFHFGEGTDGGHYTACLFHPGAQTGWIEANDSVISVVSFEYMKSSQHQRVPYLLFYRLQPDY